MAGRGPRTTVELTGLDELVDADTIDDHEGRSQHSMETRQM